VPLDDVERFDLDLQRLVALAEPEEVDLGSIKRELAHLGWGAVDVPKSAGGSDRGVLLQILMQFVVGFADLDFRDVAHVGHGRIPLVYGSPQVRARWRTALIEDGALAGILVTEPSGGSRLNGLRTTIRSVGDRYQLDGRKQYVSRISESSAFTIFGRDDVGELAAVVLPSDRPGISVEAMRPNGLRGWKWGRVSFDAVQVAEHELLHDPRAVWEAAFNHYRPLVAATALGGAARYWDIAAEFTRARLMDGSITRPRDSALRALGAADAAIRHELVAVVHAMLAVEARTANATVLARSAKARAVEVALEAIDELSQLLGAAGFDADSRAAKIQRDVAAYRWADGNTQELARSVGATLLKAHA
jgi:alkylation response protein AidB-like acyl-CoA dehydrogenase